MIKRVVNDLIKTLDKVPLKVAKHPVGLENVKNVLIHKLNLKVVDDVTKIVRLQSPRPCTINSM